MCVCESVYMCAYVRVHVGASGRVAFRLKVSPVKIRILYCFIVQWSATHKHTHRHTHTHTRAAAAWSRQIAGKLSTNVCGNIKVFVRYLIDFVGWAQFYLYMCIHIRQLEAHLLFSAPSSSSCPLNGIP